MAEMIKRSVDAPLVVDDVNRASVNRITRVAG